MFSLLFLGACSGGGVPSAVLESEEDIAGLKVGVVTGSCYDMDLSLRDDITLCRFNNDIDQAHAISSRLVDVGVNDECVFSPRMLDELSLKMAVKGSAEYPAAFGFRKTDAGLQAEFNAFLSEAMASGTIDSLCVVWLENGGIYPDPLKVYPNKGSGKPIYVGTAGAIAPISFRIRDDWFGLESEIMYLFGEYTDRPLVFKSFAPASVMMSLETGDIDIMMGCVFVTEERMQRFLFSAPYHYYHSAYFVRDDASQHASVPFWQKLRKDIHQNLIEEQRWRFITDGLLETVKITILSILLGSILGIGLCFMSGSRRKWVKKAASLYGAFMRGVPMLVLLLIMFYVVFGHSSLGASFVAVVAFGLNFASSAGGVYRTALDSVPRGQTEAGLALGFTKFQTFGGIVLPQAVKKGLPLFTGQCVALLKGTSIVGYIAVHDLTRASDLIRSRTFDAFLPLLVVTILYFLLAWLLGLLLNLIFNRSRKI
ncbi:MAG: ABC transporter permease subunit [Bacteroidales bacterium]|nr:ABC transporter permease subunit [Bacteroidales bacterium]